MESLFNKLQVLYGKQANQVLSDIEDFVKSEQKTNKQAWVTEKDVMLITYGDSIKRVDEAPLSTLKLLLDSYLKGFINAVHLLPMFPYTSDDGFSVIDYKQINPALGSWEHIRTLAQDYNLMFDAVINHISKESDWFKGYLEGNEKYANYFTECDKAIDYSLVTRPRALPLYYAYQSITGKKHIWATFSEDQVDINYKNPKVLLEVLKILVMYANNGARFIRLDAIGFIWKKLGTTCIHLPEAHLLLQIMRTVVERCAPGTILISETNVPHKENISYFGNGNEAQMVYQFPLPPLTLFSFIIGNATKLNSWAKSLEETPLKKQTSYFNFLASHDGIGMRPTEGILSDKERQLIANNVLANGGKINYKNNPDGSKTPYELNINYQDALAKKDDSDTLRIAKFIAAQCILLSVIGVPGIYIHSLLGSRNDYKGLIESGINRRINREKLDYDQLKKELDSKTNRRVILTKQLALIKIRKEQKAFSPTAEQTAIELDKRVFSIIRNNKENKEKILVLVNVANQEVLINSIYSGIDLITNTKINKIVTLKPLQYLWLKLN